MDLFSLLSAIQKSQLTKPTPTTMAHMIEDTDIQVGIEQAWHGLTKVKPEIKLDEDCEISYPMITLPLTYKVGENEVETPFKQIVSLDNGLPIGNPVSDKYCLITNEQVLSMIKDALIGTQNKVVSLGSVCSRSKVFVSIKLSDNIVAGNREHENMLNITWGHGGISALIANSGLTCIVCQNTLTLALSRKGEFNMRIKHTKNAANRLDGMSEAIDRHYGVTREFQMAMDSMESMDCEEETARKITFGILTPPTFEADTKVSTRTINMVDRVVDLYKTGKGNRGKTMADLFSGATDYFSHESSGGDKNPWKQYVSSEFGSASESKRDWFSILTDDKETNRVKARGEQILLVA